MKHNFSIIVCICWVQAIVVFGQSSHFTYFPDSLSEKNFVHPNSDMFFIKADLEYLTKGILPEKQKRIPALTKSRNSSRSYEGNFKLLDLTGDDEKVSFVYNNNFRKINEKVETKANGEWVNNILYSYQYDNLGNETYKLNQKWQNGVWVNDLETISSFTVDKKISEKSQYWDYSYWKNYLLDSMFYTSNNLSVKSSFKWFYSYELQNRFKYTYNNSNQILTEYREAGDGSPLLWTSNTYHNNGYLAKRIAKKMEWGAWMTQYTATFSYDSTWKLITELYEGVRGNDRYTYSYDNIGNLVTILHEINYPYAIWKFDFRVAYTYDNFGNPLSAVTEFWEDNIWKKYNRVQYGYDNNNNAVWGKHEKWNNNTWIPERGNMVFYYNSMTNSIEIHSDSATANYVYGITSSDDEKQSAAYSIIFQINPNPFSSSTKISYKLTDQVHVKIDIYDLLGRKIMNLIDEEKSAGEYQFILESIRFSSGIYLCKLESEGKFQIRKLILIK